MFNFVTAPFLCILVALVGFKVSDYFKRRDFEKMEKEMREKGIDEDTIALARRFFTE